MSNLWLILETMGWDKGGPYPGGGAASTQAGCRSVGVDTECPSFLPQALLPHPPPQRVSSHDAELDAGPQREALLCTGAYYGLHCWYS